MPPRLRPVSGEETIRALERLGFVQVRQRGSHVILKKQLLHGEEVGCRRTSTSGISNWHNT